MRAMMLEFPEDLGTAGVGTQYMLGGSLLVAPVFSAAGEASMNSCMVDGSAAPQAAPSKARSTTTSSTSAPTRAA